jgi:hypothetical protein
MRDRRSAAHHNVLNLAFSQRGKQRTEIRHA